MQLVKEGFSWPAFFLGGIWALWMRLWWVAILFFALNAAAGYAVMLLGADELERAGFMVLLGVGFGLWTNDARRWTLGRRGFYETDVVTGTGFDDALRRCLDANPYLMNELKAA